MFKGTRLLLGIISITDGLLKVFESKGGSSAGIYVQDEAAVTSFKSLGEDCSYFDDDYCVLWLDPRSDGRWRIGYSREKERYWADGGRDAPPVKGWKANGPLWTVVDMEEINVVQRPSLISSRSETLERGGSFTLNGGLVCKTTEWIKWRFLPDRDNIECTEDTRCINKMDKLACFMKTMNKTQTIILNGIEPAYAGIYTLQDWWGVEFYTTEGKRRYIYQLSKGKQGLVIAHGNNLESAKAVFRSDSGGNWKSVLGTNVSGRLDGDNAPTIRLIQIPNSFNKSLLENDTYFEQEEAITGVGMICFNRKNQEKTFISFSRREGRCDGKVTCKHGGDEKECGEANLKNVT